MLDRKIKVKEVRDLGAANYLITLHAPEQAPLARPGQFLMVKCCEEMNENPLLRRPFSIFGVQRRGRAGNATNLEILVKDVGAGTHKLVRVRPGRELCVLGPQGRGFHLPGEIGKKVRCACLVAGGVGIAAVFLLARELLDADVAPVLFYGARTSAELVLRDYFEHLGMEIHYATEDGSMGERGLVTAPLARFLKQHGHAGQCIYACGPWAMMRAAHNLALRFRVPCEVSLEARMGCSLGACMGCVVQAGGDRSSPHYLRVCMEGPVLDSRTVDWDFPPL
jgi:dihydroorotate dehydrogenase electron transfer subunit